MAEMLASGAVRTLTGSLSSLLAKEITIAWGLKEELEKLESTLSTIQSVLRDAEAKKVKYGPLKDWLNKLKDAANDAEDIIDECKTEALLCEAAATMKRVRKFFSLSNPLAFGNKMGHKIKKISDKLDGIAAQKSQFHLIEGARSFVENEEERITYSSIDESEIYGREQDKEKIVELVKSNISNPENAVLCIVGMGGLGKTTLAKLAYNDERIKKHFEVRIWVCVSDNFELRRLMEAIIEQVCGKPSGCVELEAVQCKLRETLSGKRFLLVLDDVWNEEQEKWDKLKSILTCGGKGSIIIVTTRSEKVAWITGAVQTFHLAYLSDEECWSLFKPRAFRGRAEHPNLVAIGKDIAKKCGGVPLAAKALGSMMCFKSEEKEWLYVRDNEIRDLSGDDILPVLRLSYDHLPSHSRQCFAYCSIFPKDYLIGKEKLIQYWMANGFIPPKGTMELEDIGCEIFNDLLWRSFFQDIEKDGDGNIIRCKMHDLVHDLAQFVTVDDCFVLTSGKEERIPEKIRHLSHDRKSIIPMSLCKSQTLRTCVAFDHFGGEIPHHISKLKYLRVLDSSFSLIRDLSSLIGNLKHLRYLHISSSAVKTIPKSITSLQNLQVLNVAGCGNLYKLPESVTNLQNLRVLDVGDCYNLGKLPKQMRKMKNLRHLKNSGTGSLTCMPIGIGQLTHLQTLKRFIVGKEYGHHIGELQKLNLRGKLSIEGLNCVRDAKDAEEAKLMSKPHLCSLDLSWNPRVDNYEKQENLDEVLEALRPHSNLKRLGISYYNGILFPSWMRDTNTLSNLIKLSLYNCNRSEDLPPLGQLPCLKDLSIIRMYAVKYFGAGFYGDGETTKAFPSLERLEFCSMPNWEEWSTVLDGREQFPQLRNLNIQNCSKLTTMPCFPSLQHLDLENCNPMILMSVSSLTSLQSLIILLFDELTFLPEGMFQNLTNLSSLSINCLRNLMFLPGELVSLKSLSIFSCRELSSLPEGLKNLTSLCNLSINSCNSLTSLSGLQYLTALESIHISCCQKISTLPNGIENLKTLRVLSMRVLPKLVSMPDELQYVTSLREMRLYACNSLAGLPECFENLTSLQYLSIVGCPNIVSLPAGLKRRAPPLIMYIERCPHLK